MNLRRRLGWSVLMTGVLASLVAMWLPKTGAEPAHGRSSAGVAGSTQRPSPSPLRRVSGTSPREDGAYLHIVTERAEPVPNAMACLALDGDEPTASLQCAFGDDRGDVRIAPPLTGPAGMLVSAPGFLTERVQVEADSRLTIVLRVGSVRVDGIVEEANGGGPVAGAHVALVDAATGRLVSLGYTSDVGRFEVGSEAGSAQLRVHAGGYAAWEQDLVVPMSDIRVKLAPGATLRGTVVEGAGKVGLPNVVVRAQGHGNTHASSGLATTDLHGGFAIVGLGSGDHTVELLDTMNAALPKEVELAVGETTSIELEASSAASILANIDVDGHPCDQAQLLLQGPSPAVANQQGVGTVRADGLVAGGYSIEARCAGAHSIHDTVELTSGQVLHKHFALDSGLHVRGRVTGLPSGSESLFTVRLHEPNGSASVSCSADATGLFDCSGMRPGRFDCSVVRNDVVVSNVQQVVLEAANVDGVSLEVETLGTLLVAVVDEHQHPLANAQIQLKQPTELPLLGRSLGAGRTVFENVPTGNYDVVLAEGGMGSAHLPVNVEAGRRTESTWTLETGVILGHALDTDGVPLADVWVSALPIGTLGLQAEDTCLTDSDGYFRLDNLTHTQYLLRARNGSGGHAQLQTERGTTVRLKFGDELDTSHHLLAP